jgi:hypothetical protein
MAIVVGLSLLDLFFLALVISFLTLFVFITVMLWLYIRYGHLPIVRQKRGLERLVFKFERNLQAEQNNRQAAIKERGRLFQAEKNEIDTALKTLQKNHIENGLANSSIKEAAIPGLGPKLKERLAGYGILSAAHVNDKISELPNFGEAKCQALLGWRSAVTMSVESTKPGSLPHEQLEPIKQKYEALQDKNNAIERKALASEELLEHELMLLKPRLRGLASITFLGYLSRSLASRGIIAALIAFVLIVTQVVSSVSATGSAIIASIPMTTATPTITFMPTNTSIPTATVIPPQTFTPTITDTPAITFTPTVTNTSAETFTPLPTFTLRPTNTPTIAPPSGGGGNSGNCHPSYPAVCIPPPPPDLDCGDISYRRFQVLSPDPHNFDGDSDGVGCES